MSTDRLTRREFSAGLLAAGASLMARPSRADTPRTTDRIRVGVIGCRNRGWEDATNFHKSGRFEIATLCDCDKAMYDVAMQHLNDVLPTAPRYEQDFRRVLDDPNIDAIVNATPDHWHALVTILALEAGKHVYHEKPASYNIQDGKALVAAQRRHPKLVVAMGTQQRSADHFKDAKQFVASGALGPVVFARAWINCVRDPMPVVPNGEPPASLDYDLWLGPSPYRPYNEVCTHYNWHFMRDQGTADTGNWGAHWLDIVRWYLDLDHPSAVAASGGRYVLKDARQWHDTQTALFDFPNCTAQWELRDWTDFRVNGKQSGAEFGGPKGTLVITRSGWDFYPTDGPKQSHPGSPMEEPHVLNFADCITDGAKPSADIIEGHKTATLCHLANIATVLGERLEFDAKQEMITNSAKARQMIGREYRKPWTLPA